MFRLFTFALIACLAAACAPTPISPVPDVSTPVHGGPSGPGQAVEPTSTPGGPTPTTDYVALPDAPGGPDIAPYQPAENPYAPQPGDDKLERGGVTIDAHDLVVRESFPVQVSLNLRGNLPTSCHQLRAVIGKPDKTGNMRVEVYSVSDPDAVCIMMLEKFDVSIPLGTYSGARHFTVFLNDEKIGEFDA